jgi:hypothetical protein
MGKKKAKKFPRKTADTARTGGESTGARKDKGWDKRLRLTGDARFTEVIWSGRDYPSWPLPRK